MSNYVTNYMGWIPAEVRYSRLISSDAKLLFCEITAGLNTDKTCRVKAADLESMYGVSRATINRWLAELEAAGMIEFVGSAKDPRGRLIKLKVAHADKQKKQRKPAKKLDSAESNNENYLRKNEQVNTYLIKNEQVPEYLRKNEQVTDLLTQNCASTLYNTTYIPLCISPRQQEVVESLESVDPVGTVPSSNFKRPTLKEVIDYASMCGVKPQTAEAFYHKQNAVDWMSGSTPIKNWQSLLLAWKVNEFVSGRAKQIVESVPVSSFREVDVTESQLDKVRRAREVQQQLNGVKFGGSQ